MAKLSLPLSALPAHEALYYLAFFCFCLFIGLSLLSPVESVANILASTRFSLQILALAALVLSLALQRYTAVQVIVLMCLGAIMFVSARQSGDLNLVWILLFVAAGRRVPLSSLAKVAFACYAAILLVGVMGFALGLFNDVVIVREGGSERSSAGFRHPNQFGLVIFELCFALYISHYPRFRASDYCVMAIGVVTVLAVADSRTSALGIGTVVLAMLLSKKFDEGYLARRNAMLIAAVFALVVGVSFYFACFYDPSNDVHRSLDSVLSGRLSYMRRCFESYPLTLFGHSTSSSFAVYSSGDYPYASQALILDNAYGNLVFVYGVVPAAIYVAACLGVFVKARKERTLGVAVVSLLVMLLFGFSEAVPLCFAYNYPLISFSCLLYSLPLKSSSQRGDAL